MKLRIDSPFIQTGIKITNLLILNFFWVIGCIPIVTIGASTIAAFTVTLKMTEGREGLSMTTQFWSAFVKNLKHGVPLTLILLAGIWSVWMDWQIFDKIEGNPIMFLILALVVIFLLLVHFLFVFPLEARYDNRLLMNLSNARKLFIRYAGRSMGLVGILFLQFLLFTQVNTILIFAGFFCLPILMIYTASQIAMPIFRQVEKTGGAVEEFEITSDLY